MSDVCSDLDHVRFSLGQNVVYVGGTVLFQLSLLEKLLCYKLFKSTFLGGPVLKISARLPLILTILSGSLLACGGSEDTPATPTSLAEKIAQTIEKNGYTTVECHGDRYGLPGYLDGTNDESGICVILILLLRMILKLNGKKMVPNSSMLRSLAQVKGGPITFF